MGKSFLEVYGDWTGFCKKVAIQLKKEGYFDNKTKFMSFYKFMKSREYLDGDKRFVDNYTWYKCWELTEEIKKKNDNFVCIVGTEGAGKSHVAKLIAPILDPKWSMEKLLYTPDALPDLLQNAKRGDCLVFDEGAMFLHSADSASSLTKQLTKLFTLMRISGLTIIVCIPNFFLLTKYAREQRAKVLINVYKRGHFRVYKKEAITKISIEGAKKNNKIDQVPVPYEWFYEGRGGAKISSMVNEGEYEDKKSDNFKEFIEDLRSVIDTKKDDEVKKKMIKISQLIKETGFSKGTIHEHMKKGLLKAEKKGGMFYATPEDAEEYKKKLKKRDKVRKTPKPKNAMQAVKMAEEKIELKKVFPKINGIDNKELGLE